jgi:putative hemolysin
MSLIKDADLRKILKIKENEGNWIVASVKYFLGIERINQIYNENSSYTGLAFVDSILKHLNIRYIISEDFKKSIPRTGPFIIIANHPLGGIDGLLLLKLVCEIRPDFKVQGNFLLQQIEPIKDYIIPVNPFESFKSVQSSYKGVRAGYQHLKEGKGLGMFPAGEVSSFIDFKITDREWQKSSIRFIQKAGVPVIPVYFHGQNSSFFYFLGQIHPLLRTAKLPSEMLKSGNQIIKIKVNNPIHQHTVSSFSTLSGLSHYLRVKTYSLSKSPKIEALSNFRQNGPVKPVHKIIDPVDTRLIKLELKQLEENYLLLSQGSFSVYCAPLSSIPYIILEIGRLREITFREAGEGTGKSIDLDQYDSHYHHLIIWDHVNMKIAGSYRIGRGKDIMKQYGQNGFYTSSLFKMHEEFDRVLENSIELGRSFIIKEYQRKPLSLFLLWKGILRFLIKNPDYQYLIGPVSISNNFSGKTKSLIVEFIEKYYFDRDLAQFIRPVKRFRVLKKVKMINEILLKDIGNNIKTLDLYINEYQKGFSLPVLIKKYLKMNGKIIGFNIDSEFNNCLDGLMIVNIKDIPVEIMGNFARVSSKSIARKEFEDLLN